MDGQILRHAHDGLLRRIVQLEHAGRSRQHGHRMMRGRDEGQQRRGFLAPPGLLQHDLPEPYLRGARNFAEGLPIPAFFPRLGRRANRKPHSAPDDGDGREQLVLGVDFDELARLPRHDAGEIGERVRPHVLVALGLLAQPVELVGRNQAGVEEFAREQRLVKPVEPFPACRMRNGREGIHRR